MRNKHVFLYHNFKPTFVPGWIFLLCKNGIHFQFFWCIFLLNFGVFFSAYFELIFASFLNRFGMQFLLHFVEYSFTYLDFIASINCDSVIRLLNNLLEDNLMWGTWKIAFAFKTKCYLIHLCSEIMLTFVATYSAYKIAWFGIIFLTEIDSFSGLFFGAKMRVSTRG